MSPIIVSLCSFHNITSKAGRLVGKASCYTVVADNAIFSLAANCLAAFRPENNHIIHVPMVESARSIFFHMFVPTSAYAVGAELYYLGFG